MRSFLVMLGLVVVTPLWAAEEAAAPMGTAMGAGGKTPVVEPAKAAEPAAKDLKQVCFEKAKAAEAKRAEAAKSAGSMDATKQAVTTPAKTEEELKEACDMVNLEAMPAADEPATAAAKPEQPTADAAPELPAMAAEPTQQELPGMEGQNLGQSLQQALQEKARKEQQAALTEDEMYPSTPREVRDRCKQAGVPSETLRKQLAQWDARNDKSMDPCFVNDAVYVAAYNTAKLPKPVSPTGPVVAPQDLLNGVDVSNAAVLKRCNAAVLEAVQGLDLQGVPPEVAFKKDSELTLTEKNMLAAKPSVATALVQMMQRFQAGLRNVLSNVTLPVTDSLTQDLAYQKGQTCAPLLQAAQ